MKRRPFWSWVDKSGECWIWTGPSTTDNYGRTSGSLAHRTAYERTHGPIADGLELDHLCRNTLCVNPDHLEPVTRRENMRRRYALMTHCAAGHEYSAANTYRKPSGYRDCRACIRERARRYKLKKGAAK